MTIQTACGPLIVVDGPIPQQPPYSLTSLARVVDVPDDRFENGVQVWPYPVGPVSVFDQENGSATKTSTALPATAPFVSFPVYLAFTCTSRSLALEEARFRNRLQQTFAAVESAGVEKEFLTGAWAAAEGAPNLYLSDGTGTFPAGNTAVSPLEGLALLEAEIAKSGRLGMIHVAPDSFSALAVKWQVQLDAAGKQRTRNGNYVVPGFGYVQDPAVDPVGHAAAASGGAKHWAYATGLVDVRRSTPSFVDDNAGFMQVLDRAINSVQIIYERWYNVSHDGTVKASVLIDRSL